MSISACLQVVVNRPRRARGWWGVGKAARVLSCGDRLGQKRRVASFQLSYRGVSDTVTRHHRPLDEASHQRPRGVPAAAGRLDIGGAGVVGPVGPKRGGLR